MAACVYAKNLENTTSSAKSISIPTEWAYGYISNCFHLSWALTDGKYTKTSRYSIVAYVMIANTDANINIPAVKVTESNDAAQSSIDVISIANNGATLRIYGYKGGNSSSYDSVTRLTLILFK